MAGTDDALESTPELPDDVLSVRELNDRIAAVVEDADGLSDVEVVGEVVNYSESGVACYFSLTDGTHEVKCLLWKNRYREMSVELADGMTVLLGGDVDYYGERGRLDVKPWFVTQVGEGDRAAELERLRAELDDRGWFADEVKRDLPDYPTTVGVVTSANGDARHDVQDAIHRRYPDVDVVVEHAAVQGDAAPTELAAGLACLDADPTVDVIVVGRGGGSDTDLAAFDTERVADAIFHAETPVVAAVGHRADQTIADAVADASAITPTAAADLVVPDKADELAAVADHGAALVEAYERHVTETTNTLETRLEDAYHDTTRNRLDAHRTRLVGAYEDAVDARLDALSTDLEDAYATLEHEHEKQAAVASAREEAAGVPTAYKVAIVVLAVLLAITILALVLP